MKTLNTSDRAKCTVALGLLATLFLAGCATTNPGPGGDEVLTVGVDQEERYAPLVAAFEEATGIEVNLIASGGQAYDEFMRTRLSAGTAPDVIRVFPGIGGNSMSVGQLANVGVLADLSGETWTDRLNDGQRALFSSPDGEVLAVPMGATGLGLVYNDAAMSAAGIEIPTTLDEMFEACDAARAEGKALYAISQQDFSQLLPFVITASLLHGPDPAFVTRQAAGDASFTESAWLESLETQLEMEERGCFNEGPNGTNYDLAIRLMATGETLAQVTFSDVSAQVATAAQGTTFTLTPFPTANDEGYLAVADSDGVAVNASAKNADAARKFVEFAASPEGQNAFAAGAGAVPALPNDEFEAKTAPQQAVIDYIAAGRTGIWPDQTWPTAEVQDVLKAAVQEMFNGSETPEGIVGRMDKAYTAGLNN